MPAYHVKCTNKSKWRWIWRSERKSEQKKKEEKENNAMPPFRIGIALTNMMNGRMSGMRATSLCIRVEWEGGTSQVATQLSAINLLSATSCSSFDHTHSFVCPAKYFEREIHFYNSKNISKYNRTKISCVWLMFPSSLEGCWNTEW